MARGGIRGDRVCPEFQVIMSSDRVGIMLSAGRVEDGGRVA